MKTVVVTAPVSEPVTLAEAKAQLRIEDSFTLDDDYISALISAARDRCESYCNQFFTEKGIEIIMKGSASGTVFLPYPNLTITSITYVDEDNATQTIAPGDCFYNTDTQELVFLVDTNAQSFNVAATTAAPVELEGVKASIKMIVTDLYELRTETAVGVSLADNPAVKAMLYPYRLELGV